MNSPRLILSNLLAIIFVSLPSYGGEKLSLLLEEDFEHGADRWQTTDVTGSFWKIIDTENGKAFRVTGKSNYEPPYRSPHSIAMLKGMVVRDFVLTARVKSTNTAAGNHRDMCLVFGYQDPAHFYYVHLATQADPYAGQIFIVDKNPRTKITLDGATETPWDDTWHLVKIVRRVADGTIEVYFDDMAKPHLTAQDCTFTWGKVGIGTFDDHGNWDNIKLYGQRVERIEVRTNP